MRTITESVEAILRESPSLAEALAEGIVNYSSLARKLRPQLEEEHMKNFTEGAVVMALKRLEKATATTRSKLHAKGTVRSITTQSNLVEYAFKNSLQLQKVQQKLLQAAGKEEESFVYFTRGTYNTALIVSESLEKLLLAETKCETSIKKFQGLSCISIRFQHDITDIPGVYYPFFQALAWRSINFVQIVPGFAELAFLLADKDVEKAYSVIKQLTQNE